MDKMNVARVIYELINGLSLIGPPISMISFFFLLSIFLSQFEMCALK